MYIRNAYYSVKLFLHLAYTQCVCEQSKVPKKTARSNRRPNVPAILKRWREGKGYTKADAARHLDIPYRTFQDWELGNRTPRGFTLRALLAEVKRR